jgi:Domain of unknown function (DUF4113)
MTISVKSNEISRRLWRICRADAADAAWDNPVSRHAERFGGDLSNTGFIFHDQNHLGTSRKHQPWGLRREFISLRDTTVWDELLRVN